MSIIICNCGSGTVQLKSLSLFLIILPGCLGWVSGFNSTRPFLLNCSSMCKSIWVEPPFVVVNHVQMRVSMQMHCCVQGISV